MLAAVLLSLLSLSTSLSSLKEPPAPPLPLPPSLVSTSTPAFAPDITQSPTNSPSSRIDQNPRSSQPCAQIFGKIKYPRKSEIRGLWCEIRAPSSWEGPYLRGDELELGAAEEKGKWKKHEAGGKTQEGLVCGFRLHHFLCFETPFLKDFLFF
jgi:hypothetical protein